MTIVKRSHWFLLSTGCLLAALVATAQPAIRTERVSFEHGKSSTSIAGSIKGGEIVDYVLGARQGQAMSIRLQTDNTSSYFNLMAPGETAAAIYNGSIEGDEYKGALPASGDYRIRVYLMRNAARRNETAKFHLEVSITGSAAAAGDAKVKGTPYHATGNIPCAQAAGQPAGTCEFGVIREGAGAATVVVTKPDGGTRRITFKGGNATGADAPGFSATREADLTTVRIGGERYEIPDAVVFGG